jgi:hypothetical protein
MGKAVGDLIPNPPTEHPEPLVSGGQGHKVVSGAARADGCGEAEFIGARIMQAEIVDAIVPPAGHAYERFIGWSAAQAKRPGSRSTRQYSFWPEVENHIFDVLVEHGPPSPDDQELPNQAALEKRAAIFIQQNGWKAAESTIRERVVDMLDYWDRRGR